MKQQRGHLSMRRRLFAVAVLAAVTCGAAVVAFVQLARTTWDQQRLDAHEIVRREVERIYRLCEREPGAAARGQGVRHFGVLRSGVLRADLSEEVPDGPFARELYRGRSEAAGESARTEELATVAVTKPGGAMFVIAARALPPGAGGYAWAAFKLTVPPHVARMRGGVLALGVASLLLVLASLRTLLLFERGAGSIGASLAALRADLRSPVARPAVRELAVIADDVAALARGFDEALGAREALARELAHRERLAALGRVVAGVAHEVRNPLAAIKLRVELALDADDLGPRHARELSVVGSPGTELEFAL